MSKLEQFYPELTAVPQRCADCGEPATDKLGVTRYLKKEPLCRDCFGKRLGRKKEVAEHQQTA